MGGRYHSIRAHQASEARKHNSHKKYVLKTRPKLQSYVVGKLGLGWSPEQIAGRLRKEINEGVRPPEEYINHESIYQYIYDEPQIALRLWEKLPRHHRKRRRWLGRATLGRLRMQHWEAEVPNGSPSWRVDETYVRVGGKWKYLFRAVDKQGRLIDFMLSDRRNTKAARRFLAKALKVMRNCPPVSITTDKLGSYPKALRRLKREGELKDTVRHRTSKYLNNRIEADHGALKRLIRPTRGFQSMKTAYATIKGFEIMRMIRRRHCILIEPGVTGEVRFVNKLFDLAA